MPSPFPGMDPFLEPQLWEDFHNAAIVVMREQLTASIGDGYAVRIERRVYVEHPEENDSDAEVLIPDVSLSSQSGSAVETASSMSVATPVVCLLAVPEERRESYLVVKDVPTGQVVTVMELLSPSNKRRGNGRREYLAKREEVICSRTHLVEFDWLRGGHRLPMASPVPPGDHYALVSNARHRPRSDVYAWRMRDRMPTIPIPLAKGDLDIALDLQAVVDTVYDRARYDRMLNYGVPLVPPVDPDTQHWIEELVADRKRSTTPQA
jgi:hypothetical protein